MVLPAETPPDEPAVVLFTADEELQERVLAVTATLGSPVSVVTDVVRLRGVWSSAALVLVGLDRAADVAALVLPRRTELYLLCGDDGLAQACTWSSRLGAAVLALPVAAAGLASVVAAADGRSGRGAQLVCVVGGSGGAGASTCAAALAVVAAQQGVRSVLVDLDQFGGGLDLLLGAEQVAGWRWARLAGARGRLGDLSGHLPLVEGVHLLAMEREPSPAGPLTPEPLEAVLLSLGRSHDLVVLDLPRALTAAARAALRQSDLTVLVVRGDLRGIAAGRQVVEEVAPGCRRLGVVVRSPRRRALNAAAVAAAVDLPLLAAVPHDDGLASAAEHGLPPARSARGPLAQACRDVLTHLDRDGVAA